MVGPARRTDRLQSNSNRSNRTDYVSVLPVFLLETDLIAVGDVFDLRHQRGIATRQDDRAPRLEPLTHSVRRDVSWENRRDQPFLLFRRHPEQVAEDVVRPSTPQAWIVEVA